MCPDNVARAVKRVGTGLECLWEDGTGPPDARGNLLRTLSVAGREILIEIEWRGEMVTDVILSFTKASGDAVRDDSGSRILLRDLVGSPQDHGNYVPMDRFVANLERLARVDRLGRDKVSCFDALDGVYVSLRRLYDYELKQTEGKSVSPDVSVLCSRSGRPAKNSREALGVGLDYWLERRLLVKEPLELDGVEATGHHPRQWSLRFSCEAFEAAQYPPIRVSTSWISDEVVRTVAAEEALMAGATFIDWQEPNPTFLPAPLATTDATDINLAATVLPNVRFVATLDPPLVVPLKTAFEIASHVGQPLPQDAIDTTTFISLLLDGNSGSATHPGSTGKDLGLSFTRAIQSYMGEERQTGLYSIQLLNPPDAWARSISEIPFSHPRQMAEILPYLRQWAFFGDVLKRSISFRESEEKKTIRSEAAPPANGKALRHRAQVAPNDNFRRRRGLSWSPPSDTDSDGDNDGMPTESSGRSDVNANLTIAFAFPPLSQQIEIEFSLDVPSEERNARLLVKIGPNAEIEVDEVEERPGSKPVSASINAQMAGADVSSARLTKKDALLKVLRISEDLGVVAEWIRRRRSP